MLLPAFEDQYHTIRLCSHFLKMIWTFPIIEPSHHHNQLNVLGQQPAVLEFVEMISTGKGVHPYTTKYPKQLSPYSYVLNRAAYSEYPESLSMNLGGNGKLKVTQRE